jgi:predicted metal-dependent phosphoesterase TrpH
MQKERLAVNIEETIRHWLKAALRNLKAAGRSGGASEQIEKLPPEEAQQLEIAGAVPEDRLEPEQGCMRIDLHCHSEASYDCITPLEVFPNLCQASRISVQAITDHNEIWGAQKLQEIAGDDLTVIVGEEISTREGEIVGLFLDEVIPAGLSPEETVEEIRRQGGLVLLPHGFDPLKRHRLRPDAVQRITDQIDIVETFNARISRPYWNRAAVEWSKERGVLMSAGSDAHTAADIGAAWVETPAMEVRSPLDLLEALEGGVPEGKWTHPALAFTYKMYDRLRKRKWRR